MSAKILVFAGSVRAGSFNVILANTLTNALTEMGADAEHLSLADYDMPIFNADIEIPESVKALALRMSYCDGMVIVSPEYNSSIPPLLKNALDWVSITQSDATTGFGPYAGKVCFLAAASPGGLGGIRSLYHLRAVLMNVGAEILTKQLALGNAGAAFDSEGNILDERARDIMKTGLTDLLNTIASTKTIASAGNMKGRDA
ncbi:MAG: NAD(P)H-dependent oxidoreductase [Rhizobiales bacterium]|nr:NAD(P)H-dependent oxidoreductase [Hyphomicrobiales bacterium]